MFPVFKLELLVVNSVLYVSSVYASKPNIISFNLIVYEPKENFLLPLNLSLKVVCFLNTLKSKLASLLIFNELNLFLVDEPIFLRFR